MLPVNHADTYTNFDELAKLKSEARKESPEALKKAAKQFESIFLNNVLKTMREAKLADGIMDNDQSQFIAKCTISNWRCICRDRWGSPIWLSGR